MSQEVEAVAPSAAPNLAILPLGAVDSPRPPCWYGRGLPRSASTSTRSSRSGGVGCLCRNGERGLALGASLAADLPAPAGYSAGDVAGERGGGLGPVDAAPCRLSRRGPPLPGVRVLEGGYRRRRGHLCLLSQRWSVRAAALTGRLRRSPTGRPRRPVAAGASARSYASFGVHGTVDRHRRQR